MLTKNIKLIHLYRYSRDYGMFRFCIADSEHDWREGTEHDKFIEKCLASVDRQKQPWLIFIAHRVLGYTSSYWQHAHLGKPMGRESFQKLWQKYKLHMAFYGRVHNYGRTCPVYEVYSLTKLSLVVLIDSPEEHNFNGCWTFNVHCSTNVWAQRQLIMQALSVEQCTLLLVGEGATYRTLALWIQAGVFTKKQIMDLLSWQHSITHHFFMSTSRAVMANFMILSPFQETTEMC